MLDLLHLGPETSDSVHRVRMYLHFAFQHPQGSDLRRMWMACAYSEHFGVCPHCVPAKRQDARTFRDWVIQRPRNKYASLWDGIPDDIKRRCATPGCANNPAVTQAKLMKVAGVTYCTEVRLQHNLLKLQTWI